MSTTDESGSATGSDQEKASSTKSSPSHSPSLIDNRTRSPIFINSHIENSKCNSPLSNGFKVDVLTPPREDEAFGNSSEGDTSDNISKPKGRLKFFKDGFLCLELLQMPNGEGIHTKWIQSKAKTFSPPVVRVAKQATIPHQSITIPVAGISTPAQQTSPCAIMNGDTYSVNHSISESTTRLMHGERKNAKPQKGISTELIFYMSAAPCVRESFKTHIITRKVHKYLSTRPYNLPDFLSLITTNGDSCLTCSCKCDKMVPKLNGCEDPEDRDKLITLTAPQRKKSFAQLLGELHVIKQNETAAVKQLASIAKKKDRTNHTSIENWPKKEKREAKRQSNEKQDINAVKQGSKRKSSEQSQQPKPILNVPGITRNKRPHTPKNEPMTSLFPQFPGPHSLPVPLPLAFSMLYGNGLKTSDMKCNDQNKMFENNCDSNFDNLNLFRAKFLSSSKFSELEHKSHNHHQQHKSSLKSGKSAISKSHKVNSKKCNDFDVCPESTKLEEKLIQQQTMNKAISYTINSLLGTGSNTDQNDRSSTKKLATSNHLPIEEGSSINPVLPPSTSNKIDTHHHVLHSNLFGINMQDQNSFLRHLLDSSHPIPSTSAGIPASAQDSACSNEFKRKLHKEEMEIMRNDRRPMDYETTKISPTSKSAVRDGDLRKLHSVYSDSRLPSANFTRNPTRRTSDTTFQNDNYYSGRSCSIPKKKLQARNNFEGSRLGNETALNLSQREWQNNQIIDLSLSSAKREALQGSQPEEIENFSDSDDLNFDNDIPLDLCKKSRPD